MFTCYQPDSKGTQHFWSLVSQVSLSKIKNLRMIMDIVIDKKDVSLYETSKDAIIKMLNDFLCQRDLIYQKLLKVQFVSSLEDFQALLVTKQALKKLVSSKYFKDGRISKISHTIQKASGMFIRYREGADF